MLLSMIKAVVNNRIVTTDSDFKETEHPRDDDGKFVEKSGAGRSNSNIELLNVEVLNQKPSVTKKVIKEYKTRKEVEEVFGKAEERFASKLSREEKGAFVDYSDQGAYLNEELRKGDIKTSRKQIELLDSAIEKSSTPKAFVATRFILVEKDADLMSLYNKTITDKGYISASMEAEGYQKMISNYADSLPIDKSEFVIVCFKIEIPKGSKAAMIQKTGNVYSSSEVVLPRNSKIGIRSVTEAHNPQYVINGMKTYYLNSILEGID